MTVIQAEKHWSCKLDHVLEEECGALESCKEEITARRSRVAWLEQIKADELKDRNIGRSGLVPLPVWRRKVKKHANRKANISAHDPDKRQKIKESSLDLEEGSPGRRVRLISDSDEGESCRNVVCVSDSERAGTPETALGLTPSAPELDSIERVRSQIVLRKLPEPESSEAVMKDIMELKSEPSEVRS